MADERADEKIGMDGKDLYRETTYTDRKVGTLQQLTPVTADGEPDTSRRVLYVGQTQVLTPAGALPLTFELDATSLEHAVELFGERAQAALESTVQRLEEMRRDQASSLIVPGAGGSGGYGGPGGGAGGGVPPTRGGGFQIP